MLTYLLAPSAADVSVLALVGLAGKLANCNLIQTANHLMSQYLLRFPELMLSNSMQLIFCQWRMLAEIHC